MPLSQSQPQAVPGNISASRKRSHAEITRSQSRSQSPQPPSKRRRTASSSYYRQNSLDPNQSSHSESSTRYHGDGFDYRRPVMSSAAGSQQNADTIDLTLEDDSPPPRSQPNVFISLNSGSDHSVRLGVANTEPGIRAPPFSSRGGPHDQPVIDLSSDDEDEQEDDLLDQAGDGPQFVPSSPEVQFMGARTLAQPAVETRHSPRGLPAPLPHLTGLGNMATLLRNMTQNIFYGAVPRELPEHTLNRIDGLLHHPAVGRNGMEQVPDAFVDEYDRLEMDYGTAAFNVNDLLIIEDGNLHQLPPNGGNRGNEPTYKEPAPAREGYTRNYDEDDLLICGFCGDELATGKTEQKQQVWIIRQCGHAYCGYCAHNRVIAKNKNNRDTKRMAGKKTNNFRTCAVPGCSKAVDSKTKMFQIYL